MHEILAITGGSAATGGGGAIAAPGGILALNSNSGIESRNHKIAVKRDSPSRAVVTLDPADNIPNRDFVLRYKVAGKTTKSEIETLDISITDDAGPRPYELFSGGEAFRDEVNRLDTSAAQIAAVNRFFDRLAARADRLEFTPGTTTAAPTSPDGCRPSDGRPTCATPCPPSALLRPPAPPPARSATAWRRRRPRSRG